MINDGEIIKCKEFLKDKGCEMCKKIVQDCKNNEGVYKHFSNHKIVLVKVDDSYISKASAIIRTHPVCKKHFKIIKRDNDKRQIKDIEITEDLTLLKYRRSDI
jgi:hypothetical protein